MYLAGEGAIWVQPDGPNTKPLYLGCHEVGALSADEGGASLVASPSVFLPGHVVPMDIYIAGSKAPVSCDIRNVSSDTLDWIERIGTAVPLYVHRSSSGRRDIFANWDRTMILERSVVTGRVTTGNSAMSAENQDRTEGSAEIASLSIHRIERTAPRIFGFDKRVVLTMAFAFSAVPGGQHHAPLPQYGWVGLAGLSGYPSNVYYTENAGITWEMPLSNPFGIANDIRGVSIVQSGPASYRTIAVLGSVDLANPAKIAYTDNNGSTWTTVTVGDVNGQYAVGYNCITSANEHDIWLVTTDGYVYHSNDAAETWIAQNSGETTLEDLYAVDFPSQLEGWAVGANNAIIKTTDGGETWQSVAGPTFEIGSTALAVHAFDRWRAWVGYDTGRLWVTMDGGATWEQRKFSESGGEIYGIRFSCDFCGYMIFNDASGDGYIYRTINGGWSWEQLDQPSATLPLYALVVTDDNNALVAGEY